MEAADWVEEGEKFAFVGLSVKVGDHPPVGAIGRNLWLHTGANFRLPSHWGEWLGTIRSGELEGCNAFLLTKAKSATPTVLDDENQKLQYRAEAFYWGLLLASRFATPHQPMSLTGYREYGQLNIRQQRDFDTPLPCAFRFYPEILPFEFIRAAQLAEAIIDIPHASIAGGHWRLFRALHVYLTARTVDDPLERLHQYCRCLEGLIGASQGDGKRQFKHRTELFLGPSQHGMMGEIYDLRGDVEHLHEDRHLLDRSRAKRLDLINKEAVVENLARSVLSTILSNQALWQHFANRDSIAQFWMRDRNDRAAIWGLPLDVNDPFANADLSDISDAQLGLG